MKLLFDPSLPGHGDITGLYFNRDRSVVAVASRFRLLTNPPARASYGGQLLRNRVALYHPPATKPFAVHDHLRYPVNDVAFHPSEPTVAIATGSYDGGWMFEGELVVWDCESGSRSSIIGPAPEVVHCEFSEDGSCIIALVRPWDEGWAEGFGDPFDIFFVLRVAYSAEIFEGVFDSDSIARQISEQAPRSGRDIESDFEFGGRVEDPHETLRREFKLGEFKSRSPIWDVAWLWNDRIGIVHDDCQLEVVNSDGVCEYRFAGPGHGVQIFKHATPLVHAVEVDEAAANWSDRFSSRLLRYDGTELAAVVDFKGPYTFSVSRDGWILGRRDRSFEEGPGKLDVIGDPGLNVWSEYDFGHYDVFNHYLRVDDSPYLFVVQGNPATSHEHKNICTVSKDGSVTPLWPLLRDTGQHADHAMECAFGYVADSVGEGLIACGRHYNPDPRRPYKGFIYRKQLQGGKELWRHETTASASFIKAIPGHDMVLVAFLNGEVAAIESGSGTVLEWTEFRPGGELSVVFSFDVSAESIVVGTIDGRIGILPVSVFLRRGIN